MAAQLVASGAVLSSTDLVRTSTGNKNPRLSKRKTDPLVIMNVT
jgi:hypothetical protein